jgi:adenine-specific DNA-methyltransferase
MFFTASNGRRIDAIRTRLHEWHSSGLLTSDAFYLLLACLIEATDAVANTTGVYAAFVKSWQSNAMKDLRLRVPETVTGTGLACRAHQGDANRFVRELGPIDLLYLDPPYNTRQYSSYYHVPEVIAEGWFDAQPVLRGKTGLIPDAHKKSDWSVQKECIAAFRDLISSTRARLVLLSYNNEGIIPPEAVEDVFLEFGRAGTLRTFTQDYARYRSDSDHDRRVYKGDSVTEYIYTVELDRAQQLLRLTGS